MPVAGFAPDAPAGARILFVQHHPERNVKRLEPQAREIVAELLDTWLMSDRGMQVRSAGRRIRGIFSPAAVYVVEMLGLRVIRLEVLVRDRPRGGKTAPMLDFSEVFLPKAEKRCAVELGVAAH